MYVPRELFIFNYYMVIKNQYNARAEKHEIMDKYLPILALNWWNSGLIFGMDELMTSNPYFWTPILAPKVWGQG